MKKTISILSIALLGLSSYTAAEEGGGGHYFPGGGGTLIDQPPTDPGWVITPMYLKYKGSVSANKALPLGGLIAADVKAESDALTIGALYTFKENAGGSFFSIGAFVPYVEMDVEASVSVNGLSVRQRETASGLGDITFVPAMFAWKRDKITYDASLFLYAPTGSYDAGSLANTGLNYWTLDPTIGLSYNNEETGFNYGIHAGATFNEENDETRYKSGSVLHIEASAQQFLPVGTGYATVGLNGFVYEQFSGDSGEGATLGEFKGSSIGIGPVLGYMKFDEKSAFVIEARWLPELETEARLNGDVYWLKAAWVF